MARKVCVLVTARPSYSRIKTALHAIKQHADLELQLVVAASALLDRYGMAVRDIEQDGFEIKTRVHMVLEGGNLAAMAKTTGLGMLELATVFDNLKPDVVVTVADRFETIATAVAASYLNIPVAHVQGGEVTGSIDEKVRHAVTKLADLHFVASRNAAERVIRMGEDPAKSVTDPWGRLHDVENVYVGDGSVFVSAGGFNPTLTIMALSLRMARHLSGSPSAPAAAPAKVVPARLPATGGSGAVEAIGAAAAGAGLALRASGAGGRATSARAADPQGDGPRR